MSRWQALVTASLGVSVAVAAPSDAVDLTIGFERAALVAPAHAERGIEIRSRRGRLYIGDVGGDPSSDLIVTGRGGIEIRAERRFTPIAFVVTARLVGRHWLRSDAGGELLLVDVPAGERVALPAELEWRDLRSLTWHSEGGTGAIDDLVVRRPDVVAATGVVAAARAASVTASLERREEAPASPPSTPPSRPPPAIATAPPAPPVVAAHLTPLEPIAAGDCAAPARRRLRIGCAVDGVGAIDVEATLLRRAAGTTIVEPVACGAEVEVEAGTLLRVIAVDSRGRRDVAELDPTRWPVGCPLLALE